MKKIILFLLVFAVTTGTSAQEFRGKVLNRISEDPLEDVRVTDLNSGETIKTDDNGDFTFRSVDFPLELEFSKSGYLNSTRSFKANLSGVKIFLQKDIDQLSEVIVRSSNIPQQIRKIPAVRKSYF